MAQDHDPDLPVHQNETLMTKFNETRGDWKAELMARLETIMAEKKG